MGEDAKDPRVEYRPLSAPHVVGRYLERRRDGDFGWEPQRVEMRCERCGDVTERMCMTGAPRQLVALFAMQHKHPLGV